MGVGAPSGQLLVLINKMFSALLKTNLLRLVVYGMLPPKPLIALAAAPSVSVALPGDAAAVLRQSRSPQDALGLHDDFAVCAGKGRKSFQLFCA